MINNTVYYNLADSENTVYIISKNGISITNDSSIPFIFSKNMVEQKRPIKTDKKLMYYTKKYYNFQYEEEYLLHDVILISRLITTIPQVLVCYIGDYGSAKTTSMKMDKLLLDPEVNNILTKPAVDEDFQLILSTQNIVCFDNVDSLNTREVSSLCQAITGSSFKRRKRFEDTAIIELPMKSAIHMNGCHLLSKRTDLWSRSILLHKKKITRENRIEENVLWKSFDDDLPYMLYLMFKALGKAIEIYPTIKLNDLGRMADFEKWGYCISEALGYSGKKFLEAYHLNQKRMGDEVIADDTIAPLIIEFAKQQHHYKNTPSEMMKEIKKIAQKYGINTEKKEFTTPQVFSRRVAELEEVLHYSGVYCRRLPKANGIRYLEIGIEDNK